MPACRRRWEGSATSPIALLELVRAGKTPDRERVGEERAAVPAMELEAGRLEREALLDALPEIERNLMRRAGAGRQDGSAETLLDRAVDMAAEDPLDLRMAADDRLERRRILERDLVV